MNRIVLKWDVPVDDQDHPIGAGRVLHVACQWSPRTVQVWTEEVADGSPPRLRRVCVYGTGHNVPDSAGDHLGSVVTADGQLVWHVYGTDR